MKNKEHYIRPFDVIKRISPYVPPILPKIMLYIKSVLLDEKYWLPPHDLVVEVCYEYYTKLFPMLEYMVDIFDCDDYAFTLRNFLITRMKYNAVFVVVGIKKLGNTKLKHAWVMILERENKTPLFIDPVIPAVLNTTKNRIEWDLNVRYIPYYIIG